jgi:hypothetical protein
MNHTPLPHLDDLTITGISLPINNGGTIHSYPILGTNSFDFDETVRGEMVTFQKVVSVHELEMIKLDEDIFNQQVKKELVFKLAEQILNNKLVEFTKQENLHTHEITYRARAFLTPDDQVRILRQNNK